MSTLAINRQLLTWAKERSGLNIEDLIEKIPKFPAWESGEKQPTLPQLENFARKTLTPLGYLFLEEPPDETLPIPNFRTVKDQKIFRPSPNLIDTVQTMQRRQDWMHDYLVEEGENPLPFVASVTVDTNINSVADSIRNTLGLNVGWAAQYGTWKLALEALRTMVDQIGILFARNSVVGNNNHRKLNVDEFRGFILIDDYAPLIFVNGADYEGAQMFTIAHELAHVWVGSGSIFNLFTLQPFDNKLEKFCNRVAAEFLVPEREIRGAWRKAESQNNPFSVLSRQFKVSPIVVARRALDLEYISLKRFLTFYENYKEEQENIRFLKKDSNKKSGGDFYNTQNLRIGKKFAHAVIQSVKEGSLLYHDAFELTGLHGKTFNEYSKKLGYK